MLRKKLSKEDSPKNITNIEKQLDANDFIVSKTDIKGNIIYCNEIFSNIAGYKTSDLIDANHNLVRHPDMPCLAFKILWDLIKNKKEFFGFVKNLCADGGFYWVFTYVTADLDADKNIVSYTSVRRKPLKSAIDTIIPIYKLLIDAEKSGGMGESQRVLNEFLQKNQTSYEEFVVNLQKGE
ncbi:MAG: PAS domain-containing protein [Sulfurimonas sp.]|uniref:PAS domain-containing protein n=1 Tax=Sulfurimonas sp. TaxID=2022749 RepID=UPI0025F7376A|nr:PAS domain-containing protein [Sulfurimonas sp.]MCK9491903.1 PAS domain-containing protein [Sulfurimonas sp.]